MQFVQVTSCAINTMEHWVGEGRRASRGGWGEWGGYSRRLAPHIFLGLSTVHFFSEMCSFLFIVLFA